MQPEARLVKQLKDYLTKRGARVVKIHGGDNPFQEAGIVDLLICYKGVFIAFEAKMPENSLSPLQIAFLHSIQDAGGFIGAGGLSELKHVILTVNRRLNGAPISSKAKPKKGPDRA